MTNLNTSINPDTGMPVLPEGMAWHVTIDERKVIVRAVRILDYASSLWKSFNTGRRFFKMRKPAFQWVRIEWPYSDTHYAYYDSYSETGLHFMTGAKDTDESIRKDIVRTAGEIASKIWDKRQATEAAKRVADLAAFYPPKKMETN